MKAQSTKRRSSKKVQNQESIAVAVTAISDLTLRCDLTEIEVSDYLMGIIHRREFGLIEPGYERNPFYQAGFAGTPIDQVR